MKKAIAQLTAEMVKARKELAIMQKARDEAQRLYVDDLRLDRFLEAELELNTANMSLKYHQGKVVAYERALAILGDAKERIGNEDDNAQVNVVSDGR